MKRLLNVLFYLLLNASGFAQMQSNHWFYCAGIHVDFSTDPPFITGNATQNREGTAAYSDPATGQLKFYCDGEKMYDATGSVMPNGLGISGSWSSTQSSLIVPKPGSSTLFYVFTNDNYEDGGVLGLRYTVVDMTLHGGLGDVVFSQKNVLLFAPAAEQLSIVSNNDCSGYWIMAKQIGNNLYNAYELTASGVSGPVISSLGITPIGWHAGQAKFSPDGSKYAICSLHTHALQLFDFDNNTGVLSNPLTLINPAITVTSEMPYGVSFSADNSKLYVLAGTYASTLSQFDLSAGSLSAIYYSRVIIGTAEHGQMQMGRNHKIYLSGMNFLSVINNPNLPGLACGFVKNAYPLPNPLGYLLTGLTNFPDHFSNHFNPCDTAFEALVNTQNITCHGDNNGMASIEVHNGIPPYAITWLPSGSTNDTAFNLAPGTHTVQLTDAAGHVFTDTFTISEPLAPLTASLSVVPNDTICAGDLFILHTTVNGGEPAYGFQWSPTAYNPGPNLSTTVFATSVFVCTAIDKNGCHAVDSITIHVIPTTSVTVDQTYCPGQPVVLHAGVSGGQYEWSTGDTTENITVAPYGNVVFSVTYNTGSCSATTHFNLSEAQPFNLDVHPLTNSVCPGETVVVQASTYPHIAAVQYTWPGGLPTSTDQVTVNPTESGWITVSATDGICPARTDSTYITVIEPGLPFTGDTCICQGTTLNLQAAHNVYWSTGTMGSSIMVGPDTLTTYICYDTLGACNKIDTVTVCVKPLPLLEITADTLVSMGQPVLLDANGTGNFSWSPVDGLSCVYCPDPLASPAGSTVYTVTLTNEKGCTTQRVVLVDCTLYIPNIITPNGDGTNDVFRITGLPARSGLSIFNRWGNPVFETGNYQNDWMYNSDGVYYYVLKLPDGKTFNGFVHVTGN